MNAQNPALAADTSTDVLDHAAQSALWAYRTRMDQVMAGVLAASTPEAHREWLEAAEQCLRQFDLVSAWIERQKGTVSPPSEQS
jgi:hypothetical protein